MCSGSAEQGGIGHRTLGLASRLAGGVVPPLPRLLGDRRADAAGRAAAATHVGEHVGVAGDQRPVAREQVGGEAPPGGLPHREPARPGGEVPPPRLAGGGVGDARPVTEDVAVLGVATHVDAADEILDNRSPVPPAGGVSCRASIRMNRPADTG